MPIVDFYAEPDYFEQLAEAQDKDLSNEVVETGFVNSDGWTTQRQSLLNAEQSYSGTSHGEHEYSGWEPRITGVNNNGEEVAAVAYDNDYSDSEEHLEAWTTANAGATNSDVRSSSDDGETSIFDGGFAAECSGAQRWEFEEIDDADVDDRWECGAGVPMDVPAMLPQTEDNKLMALIISPTITWDFDRLDQNNLVQPEISSFPLAISGNEDQWNDLQSYDAECWPGSLEDRQAAEDEGNIYSNSGSVNEDDPFGFYVELEEAHDGAYACSWEFSDGDREFGGTIDQVVQLELDNSTLESRGSDYPEFKRQHLELREGFSELEDGVSEVSDFESEAENMALDKVN